MLANENEYLSEASETMRELISEQTIRDQCYAREEYERHERAVKAKMDKLNATITEKDVALSEKDLLIAQLQAKLEKYESMNE